MPELQSEFLFTIRVGVSKLHDVGNTPFGLRHIDILGAGSFAGPRLEGKVLPGSRAFGNDKTSHGNSPEESLALE